MAGTRSIPERSCIAIRQAGRRKERSLRWRRGALLEPLWWSVLGRLFKGGKEIFARSPGVCFSFWDFQFLASSERHQLAKATVLVDDQTDAATKATAILVSKLPRTSGSPHARLDSASFPILGCQTPLLRICELRHVVWFEPNRRSSSNWCWTEEWSGNSSVSCTCYGHGLAHGLCIRRVAIYSRASKLVECMSVTGRGHLVR